MVIESFCSASPESDAPAEQAVSSRLVAAAAATHVMMRGVFIVLLEFADRRGVVHQHSSIASLSDVLTWRSVHVRMLETVKDGVHRRGCSARIAARESKATHRWEREFFSSGLICAAVYVEPSGRKIGAKPKPFCPAAAVARRPGMTPSAVNSRRSAVTAAAAQRYCAP